MEIITDSFDFITINELTSKLSSKFKSGEMLNFETIKNEISKPVISEVPEKKDILNNGIAVANKIRQNEAYLNKILINVN